MKKIGTILITIILLLDFIIVGLCLVPESRNYILDKVSVYSNKYKELEKENEALQKTKAELELEIEQKNNEINVLTIQITSLRKTINDNEILIAELEEEIEELQNSLDSKDAEIEQLNENIRTLNYRISVLTNTNNDLQQTINSLNSRITQLQNTITELNEELSQYQTYFVMIEDNEFVESINITDNKLNITCQYNDTNLTSIHLYKWQEIEIVYSTNDYAIAKAIINGEVQENNVATIDHTKGLNVTVQVITVENISAEITRQASSSNTISYEFIHSNGNGYKWNYIHANYDLKLELIKYHNQENMIGSSYNTLISSSAGDYNSTRTVSLQNLLDNRETYNNGCSLKIHLKNGAEEIIFSPSVKSEYNHSNGFWLPGYSYTVKIFIS